MFSFCPPTHAIPLASLLSYFSLPPSKYTGSNPVLFQFGGVRAAGEGWVVWNRRLSKLSFHVLFLWYVTEGWGVVPSRLTNMQGLSSHGWNNLYWGMFGSQGRIIFQSIPFVSCTAKWKWAPPKNTKGKSLLDDRRQNWHESSPPPVLARWFSAGSSTELLLHPPLNSKAPPQVHWVSYWLMHWFHCVSWLCRRRLRLLPGQHRWINALVRQQPTPTETSLALKECECYCGPLMCWRSHVTESRVIREEVGSRRRGEGRKKCSFSLRLSCLWELSQLGFCRMPSLCPARSLRSKASAVCHCVRLSLWLRICASELQF